MTRVLLKWLLMGVLIMLFLAALAASAVALVMNTETGTRWALARVAAAAPGELDLGDFEGTLWRGLRFGKPRYGVNETVIEATDLYIEIGWLASAIGNLQVDRLSASTLRITAPSSGEASDAGLDVPPAPLSIRLTRGNIGTLSIDRDGRVTEIADIRLRGVRYADVTVTADAAALAYDELGIDAARLSLTLAGDGPLRADVEWQLAEQGWSGRGPLRGSLAAVRFDQDVAGRLAADVSGEALLYGRAEPLIDATVRWDRWTFETAELVDGEVSVTGFVDDYTITAAAADVLSGGRRVSVAGSGAGNRNGLERFDATVQFAVTDDLPTTTTASGRVRWSPDIVATAGFSSNAEFDGRALEATGTIDYTPQELRCSGCRVSSGPNRVDVDGVLSGDVVNARLALDIPQLGELLPGYSGAVSGRASLRASGDAPQLEFDLAGRQLGVAQAGDMRIDADVTGSARGDGDGFNVDVATAVLREATVGRWQLVEGFGARWSGSGLDVAPHSWRGDQGVLEVSTLRHSDDQTTLAASMDNVSLDQFNSRLPSNMRLAGVAYAAANLQRTGADWSGTLSWRQDGTTLTVTEVSDEVTTIDIPEAFSDVRFENGGIVADATLAIEPAARAALHVELARLARDAPLVADLEVQGDDFTWVSALVPTIDRVDGTIAAEITADGAADAPQIRGSASWRDGSLLLPALNVPLDDIDIVVSGASAGNLQVEGAARAGDGALQLRGEVQDIMSAGRTFELSVDGADAELVNWPEYRIWASPNLRLVGRGGNWRYSGEIAVPRAEVRLRELPTNAVTVSSDVVVVGEDIEEIEPIRWSGDARVELGDDVHFDALGLDTRLTGDLRVRAQPERPLALTGSVSLVDGSFEAYGQKLTIREGQLTFTGPVDDPLVDVRAVRVVDTFDGSVTAGLHVYGRAQDLTSTVFSEPSMADADALSYLVVGRPLNEATEAEGGDISGAAVSLGLKQATRITQQIGQSVGLDQLAVTGDGGETTALVAGKQINSRLYARYAYGVFSRVGVLLLRYRLTPNLTLEAGAGETQSIDILYSIERD